MSKVLRLDQRQYIPLVTVEDTYGVNTNAVPIHHGNLDSLIGRLMNMFELNGDVTQREAQKIAAKNICRDWLDDQYQDVCGYDKYRGELPGGETMKLDLYHIEMAESLPEEQ